ncbi:MAG: BON domain-containing protein [Burkholderiales bacterium]
MVIPKTLMPEKLIANPLETLPGSSLRGRLQMRNERKVAFIGILAFAIVTILAVMLRLKTELSLHDIQRQEMASLAPDRTIAKDTILVPVKLSIKLLNGKASLRGTLPDETAHKTILARAHSIYGRDRVEDNLEVMDGVVLTPWFDSVIKWFPPTLSGLNSGEITISGLEVLLFGDVSSPTDREAAGKLIERLAGVEAKIHNGLRVITAPQSATSGADKMPK